MKKIIAIVMALVMVLTLASCGSSKSERDAISAKIDALSEKLEEVKQAAEAGGSGNGSGGSEDIGGGEDDPGEETGDEDVTGEVITDASGEAVTDASGEKQTAAPKTTKSSSKTTTKKSSSGTTSNDPSKWSTAQIVDYYKVAASKTKGKSGQKMTIQDLPTLLKPIKGSINNALEKRSAPFDGITGGYKGLQASDLTSANAKASGNYVIINMNAKEQIDGVNGKATEGTTGHLVSVLDGVKAATDALNLPADYPEGSVKLDYKNGFAKNIKINTKTGQIESGEWGYDLYVTINGAKLAGIPLNGVNATIIYRVHYPA